LPKGNPTGSNQYKKKEIGNLPIDNQAARAEQNGISPRTQRDLDWLARYALEQHERVKQGAARGGAAPSGTDVQILLYSIRSGLTSRTLASLSGRSNRLVRRVCTRLTSWRERRIPLRKTPTEEGAMATTLGTVTALTMSLLVVSALYAAVLVYPLRSLCSLTP
jgi:hypothetical protein